MTNWCLVLGTSVFCGQKLGGHNDNKELVKHSARNSTSKPPSIIMIERTNLAKQKLSARPSSWYLLNSENDGISSRV